MSMPSAIERSGATVIEEDLSASATYAWSNDQARRTLAQRR
jgi:hypothetical protein